MDAIAIGTVFLLLGLVVYFTMVRRAIQRRRVTRLADATEADEAFVVQQAIRLMAQARSAPVVTPPDHQLADRELQDRQLKATTFHGLRSLVQDLDLGVADEAVWEAVDRALAHHSIEIDDKPGGAPLAGPNPTREPDRSAQAGALDAAPRSSTQDADGPERPERLKEAEMTITDLDAISDARGEDIVLLKAVADGGYETLGEWFKDADAAGAYLTRELVRAYFPDWLPDSSGETANENTGSVHGPWGPAPAATNDTAASAAAQEEAAPTRDRLGEADPIGDAQRAAIDAAVPASREAEPLSSEEPKPSTGGGPDIREEAAVMVAGAPRAEAQATPTGPTNGALEKAPNSVSGQPVSLVTSDGSGVTIRRGHVADAARVAELANALDREVSDGNVPHSAASVVDGMLSGRAGLVLWVVVPDGGTDAVGYALVQDMYDTDGATWITWLHDLYVNEDWRSRDIGDRLMTHLASMAKSLGHEGLWWGVHRNNWKAERFYRRIGAERAPIYVMGLAGAALSAAADRAA